MKTVTIGRSNNNEVVIQDSFISSNHCTITQDDNGNFLLCDLGSSNGTYVNGLRVQQTYLKSNDIVKIGETLLPWQEYFSLSSGSNAKGKVARRFTIGRTADNNIVISDSFVSSHHAELQITDMNEVFIKDLGSSNGTFVNDLRITSSALLTGDRVRIARSDLNWMSYINLHAGRVPVKSRRKINPWIGVSIGLAAVIIIFFSAWGIRSYLNRNDTEIPADSLVADSAMTRPGNLTQMVKFVEKSVFMVKSYGRGQGMQGTGFFIDETGLGVTNNHVIQDGNRWTIKTIDNHEYEISEFLERNKEYDYAVFRIENKGQTFNYLRRSKTPPQKGDEIFVLGNPQGMESTLTKGIVSSIRGGDENDIMHGKFKDNGNSYIQIDVAVSHGSSGSPVMNMKGEVIGIATLSFQEANCINCNFALNIQKLADYMKTSP
jgi:pSer/pThr/pTyr-binding forkhead associated (FHA) protein